MTIFLMVFACVDKVDLDTATEVSSDYFVPDPTEEMVEWLQNTPVQMPFQRCTPYTDDMDIPIDSLVQAEDGSMQVCVWNHVSGAVPEGHSFTDFGTCEEVWTQGPSWFYHPESLFDSDDSLLDDADYMAELDWVRSQGKSSGCACCHSSEMTGYASKWDYDAPGIWTDTMPLTGIVMAAGLADEHTLFGFYSADQNHGFNREETLIPTTDIERMKAFFKGEFERRGGTQADIDAASEQFLNVNYQLFESPVDCITPFEGVDSDGSVIWNGTTARQIYIQELGANNPGFMPNFDLPEGTIWALYADPNEAGFESGEIQVGELPFNGLQQLPADGSTPVLEPGKRYRLFVTPDIMNLRLANCTFEYAGE
ncbi:MAG: hypothetical protein VXZ96_20610 [Myxococcota bacterium]|nr:hypothetical protein [Myxococcota bacterium]